MTKACPVRAEKGAEDLEAVLSKGKLNEVSDTP